MGGRGRGKNQGEPGPGLRDDAGEAGGSDNESPPDRCLLVLDLTVIDPAKGTITVDASLIDPGAFERVVMAAEAVHDHDGRPVEIPAASPSEALRAAVDACGHGVREALGLPASGN